MSGQYTPETPWQWGWSWKKDSEGRDLGIPITHFTGKRVALGVSGTHEKGNHLVGARTELKSVLIATNSATDADALSTAFFVSGWEEASHYLQTLPLQPAVAWIDEQDTPHWNGMFNKLWNGALGAFLAGFSLILVHALTIHSALADDTVDLGAMDAGTNTFTPYVYDRNKLWVLLPIFMFLVVCSHLRKTKPKRETKGSLKKV